MDKALQTFLENIPVKTGKTLEEWFAILKTKAIDKHSEAVKFLKEEYGMTHGFANAIVQLSKKDPGETTDDLVEGQFAGKENLRPVYERLKKEMTAFGPDVEFAPKKAYVSVRRKKQFAILQPSTKSRFDIGLNLKGEEPAGILEPSGSFNAMCTHRIRLESINDVSPEVIAWLKAAYERAG